MAAGSATKHPTNVAKSRFWDAVLQAAETRLREPFLFVGDWNTGAHRLDETGKTFVCADHFGRLSTLGLDGHVAASQPWHYGVDLVFEVEGRHERQRIPARSCVRDPVAVVAHHVLPLLARATGVRGFGSLDGARGAKLKPGLTC